MQLTSCPGEHCRIGEQACASRGLREPRRESIAARSRRRKPMADNPDTSVAMCATKVYADASVQPRSKQASLPAPGRATADRRPRCTNRRNVCRVIAHRDACGISSAGTADRSIWNHSSGGMRSAPCRELAQSERHVGQRGDRAKRAPATSASVAAILHAVHRSEPCQASSVIGDATARTRT
jgi:hypothetical protein